MLDPIKPDLSMALTESVCLGTKVSLDISFSLNLDLRLNLMLEHSTEERNRRHGAKRIEKSKESKEKIEI